MRYFLLFIFFYLSSTCFLFAQKPIVLNATLQHWQGGVYGSGGGINYKIQMIAPLASNKFNVDKMWVKDKYLEVKVTKGLPRLETEFTKGDTIFISASQYFPGKRDKEMGAGKEEKNIPCPKKYVGDALISYTLKGKRKYLTLEKIAALPPLNYP